MTNFCYGKDLIQEVFWLKNFLIKYRNNKSIGYWNEHKEEYQKLLNIENWIKKSWHLMEETTR